MNNNMKINFSYEVLPYKDELALPFKLNSLLYGLYVKEGLRRCILLFGIRSIFDKKQYKKKEELRNRFVYIELTHVNI